MNTKLRWPSFGSFVASFSRRLLFRGVFLLLALAVIAMSLAVLQDEKERSLKNYQASFGKTLQQVTARLNHPAGHLALLNPPGANTKVTPLRPLVLPYAAVDFDDASKVQTALENAGCFVQYKPYGATCVAIGSNPYAGGFVYVAGRFQSGNLVSRMGGERDTRVAHRVRVSLDMRGQNYRWLAPFERIEGASRTLPAVALTAPDATPRAPGIRGRLTGFMDSGDNSDVLGLVKPIRDFRGWIWQSPDCAEVAEAIDRETCAKRSFFSVRLPVELLSDGIYRNPKPVWPPTDLEQILVRVQVFEPNNERAIFDSNDESAIAPFSLNDLQTLLLPGETVQIRKANSDAKAPPLATITGQFDEPQVSARWIDRILRLISSDTDTKTLSLRETIATSLGNYDVQLMGDTRSVDKALSTVATRVSWYVGAMLGAIALAWLIIEIGFIRRIALLTRRAREVSHDVRVATSDRAINAFNVEELRGKDELGILASGLHDLMQRVNEDVKREHIRAEQERDTWHAVGHEIMSPLQSLMVLHKDASDPSHRYIARMQQAVRVLYGHASPSEAFESTQLSLQPIDLATFLQDVAKNAPDAGIANVVYSGAQQGVSVKADEYSLEDVVTHILRNADRYRIADSAITIDLAIEEGKAIATIRNRGERIPADLIDKIFVYGVSDPTHEVESASDSHRGQGLFVAKTYMAKMGGTITAKNESDGVSFVLKFPRIPS
ncbi:MAG: sensor histidine kinase [Casimicrobium sp.]